MPTNINTSNNTVVIQPTNYTVTVTNNNVGSTTNVTNPYTTVINVASLGPQGIPGVQGVPGDSVFSNLGGGVFATTSSIQVTGSFTVSGSSTFTNIGPTIFSGSVNISGSAIINGNNILTTANTGSLNVLSSSYASTASLAPNYVLNSATSSFITNTQTGSFATTGSNQFNGNQTITGSLIQGLEGNIATGENSHAEGSITKAIGNYSHAEGDYTQAKGDYSHAEGQETIASGSYSHAEGYQTIALANHQHVQGQWNAASSVPAAFIVGNGTDDNNRSNLIHAAGNEVQITGSLTVSGATTMASALVSGNVTVLGTASINVLQINTTINSTGSNQLGDAPNDTQTLFGSVVIPTGSLIVSGSTTLRSNKLIGTDAVLQVYTRNATSSLKVVNDNSIEFGANRKIILYPDTSNNNSSFISLSNLLKSYELYSSGINGGVFFIYNRSDSKSPIVVTPDKIGLGVNTDFSSATLAGAALIITASNVGIGTATPTASLHISASNTSSAYSFLVQNSSGQILFSSQNDRTVNINSTNATNGNTNIGTTNGTITFNQGYNNTFVGNALTFYNGGVASTIQGFTTNPGIAVGYAQTTTNPNTGSVFTVKGTATTSGSGVLFVTGSSATRLLRVSSETNANILVISGSGNVGIGTGTPAYPLDVNGTIRSQGQLIVVGQIQNPTIGVVDVNGVLYTGTGVSIGVNSTNAAKLLVRGSGATSATTTFLLQNSTPTNLLSVLDNGQVAFTSPTITLATSQSAFIISPIISASNTIGGQYYGVNITPTFYQTTASQTETAFRVAATFSQSSAVATGGTNIIADFGSTSAGSQLTVTDVTSGSIYMVNDVSGIPIIEATSNWDVNMYDFPNKVFEKTGTQVNIYGTMRVSGSFILPLSQSTAPQLGSAYWSGSLLFIYNGTRYMSASFA
jgi:hypothetical protein